MPATQSVPATTWRTANRRARTRTQPIEARDLVGAQVAGALRRRVAGDAAVRRSDQRPRRLTIELGVRVAQPRDDRARQIDRADGLVDVQPAPHGEPQPAVLGEQLDLAVVEVATDVGVEEAQRDVGRRGLDAVPAIERLVAGGEVDHRAARDGPALEQAVRDDVERQRLAGRQRRIDVAPVLLRLARTARGARDPELDAVAAGDHRRALDHPAERRRDALPRPALEPPPTDQRDPEPSEQQQEPQVVDHCRRT